MLVGFLPDRVCALAWDELLAAVQNASSPTTGWAVLFKIILAVLSTAEESVAASDDDDALAYLQSFQRSHFKDDKAAFFSHGDCVKTLLAHAKRFETEASLEDQLDALQDEFDGDGRSTGAKEEPIKKALLSSLSKHTPYMASLLSSPGAPAKLKARAVSLDSDKPPVRVSTDRAEI